MNQFLSDKIVGKAITVTAGAAGTSDITGLTVDCANVEGVAFIVQLGAIVTGAVTSIKLQESADDSTWSDVTSATLTIADTDDEGIRVLDYRRPLKRYVRVYVDRGTQNATVNAAYIKYGARVEPTSQPSGTAAVSVSG